MTTRAGIATRTPTTMATCGFSPACPSSVDDDSVTERPPPPPPPPPLSRTVTVEWCVELTADVKANGDDMTTSSDVIDRTNGSEILAVAADVITFADVEVDDVNTIKAKALSIREFDCTRFMTFSLFNKTPRIYTVKRISIHKYTSLSKRGGINSNNYLFLLCLFY